MPRSQVRVRRKRSSRRRPRSRARMARRVRSRARTRDSPEGAPKKKRKSRWGPLVDRQFREYVQAGNRPEVMRMARLLDAVTGEERSEAGELLTMAYHSRSFCTGSNKNLATALTDAAKSDDGTGAAKRDDGMARRDDGLERVRGCVELRQIASRIIGSDEAHAAELASLEALQTSIERLVGSGLGMDDVDYAGTVKGGFTVTPKQRVRDAS